MAVRVNASGDGLVRTTNLPSVTGFSMLGWFKISVDRNNFTSYFARGNSASVFYAIGAATDGTTFSLYNGSTSSDGASWTVGDWHHVALVCAGTGANQLRAYLDGVLTLQMAGNASVASGTMYVNNDGALEYNNGLAAAVKIYDAVLTDAEIATEMHSYLPRRTANLNGFYPMFAASGAEVDYSGNGYNWGINGTLDTEDGPPLTWGTPPVVLTLTSSVGYTITADAGTFTMSGTAMTPAVARKLIADGGSFTVTGTAASPIHGYKLGASGGSFTVTGTDAGLRAARKIAASGGTFLVVGTDATLTYTPQDKLIADPGSFGWTGTAAGLVRGYRLAADSGSFTMTGTAMTPRAARKLIADNGTFLIGEDGTTILIFDGSAGDAFAALCLLGVGK